ncbi:ankyrin repeat and SAM domain-containing protein 1A-like isoform X12 [Portunus trituberculatus]|uniref:ankyrin repeat and SAM domain-containing protein 1A-like isoform X12 n=1 Tax=Portunus trituberculatus TaxID=210409 RepID=UPI001E1CF4E9|nr:ankyrin repeat and SAM domain-containing protein 1A-like isoform X12 [Portunus trituberculatus]
MGKDAELLEAARNGSLQVVEKILSARSRRSGPLASLHVLEYLRRGPGANVQDSSGYTALHLAALNGHKDVVALLLAHEASCNVQDGEGSTPLHLAAWAGHTEVVRTLLHQGPSISNVNHQNKGGETALHCAAQYGHTEAAQLLLARGGDPTVPNLQAETALDLAAQYGRLNTVEVLVRAHPDLLRPYTVAAASAAVFPHTPLHRASRNGHREVVKLLLTRGHHVNVRTGQGAPLHEAALCGKVDVVRVLLEAGADPEVRDDRGHTVLDTISLINTPITQEITNLIKYHGHLINLSDDDEDPGDPPPWSPPVWPPPSWSPLAVPAIPAPSEVGSPYENVLIPTIVHPEMSVEDGDGGRGENRASSRASDRESRASDRESRASDRESRTSDRESRTSDRESRMSDRDGRTSVASRVSEATSDWSIYDVPPPPKTVGGGGGGGGSDRGSISYRSQTSEGGDDDGVYEVPPPPRSCRSSSTSLRTSRDSRHLRPSSDEMPPAATSPGSTSSSSAPVTRRGGGPATTDTTSGSKVVEPLPPPKPPRRSMCPPSPTPDSAEQDQGTYEAIFFKGQDQSDYENVDVQQKQQLQPPPSQPIHSRTRSSSATFTHSHTHDSSDSDYDTPRPMQPAHAHSNRQEKRPSRDIETETEPEEVLALEAGGSSCSLSSVSASLSDRSVSTDHIEEVKSDIPFAGLFRGSVITPMEGPEVVSALERPRSLTTGSGLRPSLDRGCRNSMPSGREQGGSGGSSGSGGVGLLSPLEEAEEWARINDIMASFGGGLARESVFMAELEHEFQTRLGLSLSPSQQGLGLLTGGDGVGVSVGVLESGDKTVGGWLRALGLPQYEDVFAAQGYDDTDFMNGGILESGDLRELGITQASHVQALGEAVSQLPTPFSGPQASYTLPDTVDAWLESIRLPQYSQIFHKNGFGEMERVRKVWEIELTTVLEITRPGHRKRILASLGERPLEPELPPALDPHDLSLELSRLNSDISQLKEQLLNDLPSSTSRERRPPESTSNTIRRSGTKKRSAPQPPANRAPRAQPSMEVQGGSEQLSHLPIRDPSQLVVGAPNTLHTTWKHHPTALVSASVQYIAQYLGSTHVKELKGTESTMRSIQKLKKTPTDGTKVPKIILSVSFRGVKFMEYNTQTLVCEHEIRNIHCACQDAEDLSHFAYITKDLETKGHYCHVFRVQTRELATEIILTLGEAFEVAYQLALREQPYTNQSDEQKLAHGHTRSKSEHLRGSRTLSNGSSHTRSHSTVPQQMSIGGVSSSSAENLLSDSGNGSEKECGSRRDSLSSVPSNQSQMNGS